MYGINWGWPAVRLKKQRHAGDSLAKSYALLKRYCRPHIRQPQFINRGVSLGLSGESSLLRGQQYATTAEPT